MTHFNLRVHVNLDELSKDRQFSINPLTLIIFPLFKLATEFPSLQNDQTRSPNIMQMFLKAGQKLLDAAIVLSAPRGGRSIQSCLSSILKTN